MKGFKVLETKDCSFCKASESRYNKIFTTEFSESRSNCCICEECIGLCVDILKEYQGSPDTESKLICSFCNSNKFAKAITGPSDTIVCNHCVSKFIGKETSMLNNQWKTFCDNFIGQAEAKLLGNQLIAQSLLNQKRQEFGLINKKFKLNAVFSGSAGSGKTTFAKTLGKQLAHLGILSEGDFYLKTKSDFVGQHVGETESKTRRIIEDARGSVLFIDEAYSLAPQDDAWMTRDFGYVALNTIMEEMDKMENDIMIIFAGYEKDLERIFKSNDGYRRRFPHSIKFTDYSLDELVSIFKNKTSEYFIDTTNIQMESIKTIISHNMKKPNFGNGGYITNLLEKISMNRDLRLSKKDISTITKEELTQIETSDFAELIPVMMSESTDSISLGNKIKNFN